MTTTEQVTTLTANQATAQVQAWIAAGLPGGYTSVREQLNEIAIMLDTFDDLQTWAAAVGRNPKHDKDGSWSVAVQPVDLPGWSLEIWTYATRVTAPIRIEVLP